MIDSLLQSALKLPTAQRILLVEQLWDSIAHQQDGPPLTADQKTELDNRLRRLQKTGPRGATWPTIKKRLTRRSAT